MAIYCMYYVHSTRLWGSRVDLPAQTNFLRCARTAFREGKLAIKSDDYSKDWPMRD